MAVNVRLVQAILVALSATGFYLTYGLALNNGTFDFIRQKLESKDFILPGSKEPLRTFYTGIDAIDKQLTLLACFFWPALTGEHLAATTLVVNMSGQFASAYALVVIEGMRRGNKGKYISYVMLWGLLYQNIAYTVAIPLTLALQLGTSPTVDPTVFSVMPDASEVAAVPISVFTGFLVPAVFMSLPFPTVLTSDQKQIALAIWQIFPITITISQQIFKRVFYSLTSLSSPSRNATLWSLRFAYAFNIWFAASGHLSTVTLATIYDFFTPIFAKNIGPFMGLMRTFVPQLYSHTQKAPNFAEGVFTFLQWDGYVGSAAVLLWATVMLGRALPPNGSKLASPVVLLSAIVALVTTGPVGAATLLIWIRDEVVLGNFSNTSKKTN